MPTTRMQYAKKKSCKEEENKENIEVTQKQGPQTRSSKKDNEDIHEETLNLTVKDKGPPDEFDLLYSSPLKQEVSFKPLSFWSKKVKDLESKEKGNKKKKYQLYELSDTDSSSSSRGGKRIKKKGRATIRRPRKNTKKVNNVVYQFNPQNFSKKKESILKQSEQKEGSLIRERILLKRLNDKFLENEEKFTFDKIKTFGTTSTPGKSDKLNVVGGSSFEFLSPIPNIEGFKIGEKCGPLTQETLLDISQSEEKFLKKDATPSTTPKRASKRGNNENVLTKDLKRVSEYEPSRNEGLECSYVKEISGFDGNSKNTNSLTPNAQDTVFLNETTGEENLLNKSFLYFTEDENRSQENCYRNVEFRDNNEGDSYCFKTDVLDIDIIRRSISLQGYASVSSSGYDSVIPMPNLSETYPPWGKSRSLVRCMSQFNVSSQMSKITIIRDETNISKLGIKPFDNTDLDYSCNCVLKHSFCNVTVRRRYNDLLNFRKSAKGGSFDIPRGKDIKNDSNGDNSCTDFLINCSERLLCEKDFFAAEEEVNQLVWDACCVGTGKYESTDIICEQSLSPSHDQQTFRESTLIDYHMGSNQYRSSSIISCEETVDFRFNVGTDSSVFESSSGTLMDSSGVDCTVCKYTGSTKNTEKTLDKPYIKSQIEMQFNSKEPELHQRNSSPSDLKEYNDTSQIAIRNEIKVMNSPIISSSMGNTFGGDITLSNELDSILPIFESTTCTIPVKKTDNISLENKKRNNNENTEIMIMGKSFENLDDWEHSYVEDEETTLADDTSCQLKAGKQWFKSSCILKKALNGTLFLDEMSTKHKGRRFRTLVKEVMSMQTDNMSACINSIISGTSDLTQQMSRLEITKQTIGNRTVKVVENEFYDEIDCSFRNLFKTLPSNLSRSSLNHLQKSADLSKLNEPVLSARDVVLKECNQVEPLPFEEYFNEKTLQPCRKIGEGAFGEVFKTKSNCVIKIIPIEGEMEINGGAQKTFIEILTEVIIAKELSNLRNTDNNKTNGFCELKRCWCVFGKYPEYLIHLWNEYDRNGSGSENDSPSVFQSDQLYLVFEFADGGRDLETYVFSSAEQSLSVFYQLVYSLAVAERMLEFEHRDLHWGNVLIAPTREKYFKVLVDNEEVKIPMKGVKVTIIDFTLSRIFYNGCNVYYDLSDDPTLFTSKGDYQFDIYRMMRNEVRDDWSQFKPKTNIFWMHYILRKMIKKIRYKRTDTKIHKTNVKTLEKFESLILEYNSTREFLPKLGF